jgi:hypothetical protein
MANPREEPYAAEAAPIRDEARAALLHGAAPLPAVELRRYPVAINEHLIDKNASGDEALFSYGWRNVEVTLPELEAMVKKGWAYTSQLDGKRKAANFRASGIVSVDVDYGMTLDQAFVHPLIAESAGLIYSTVNHRPDAHRFRIAFAMARVITDANEMRAIARSLALRLNGDPAAVDAARIYYGNREAQTWLLGN